MAAERITITPSELRSSAANFTNKAEEIEGIWTYLQTEVNNLESTWDGAAQDRFFLMYNELQPSLKQISEQVLPGIASALEAVAQTLEDTDAALATQLGSS